MQGRPPGSAPRLSHLRGGGVERPAVCCVASALQAPGWSLMQFPADLVPFRKRRFSSACSSQTRPGKGLGCVLRCTINLCKESQRRVRPACSPWSPGTGWSQCDPATVPVPPSGGLRVAPYPRTLSPARPGSTARCRALLRPAVHSSLPPAGVPRFCCDSSYPGDLPLLSSLGQSPGSEGTA